MKFLKSLFGGSNGSVPPKTLPNADASTSAKSTPKESETLQFNSEEPMGQLLQAIADELWLPRSIRVEENGWKTSLGGHTREDLAYSPTFLTFQKEQARAGLTTLVRYLMANSDLFWFDMSRTTGVDQSQEQVPRTARLVLARATKSRLNISADEAVTWIENLRDSLIALHGAGMLKTSIELESLPLAQLVTQIEREATGRPLPPEIIRRLEAMWQWPELRQKGSYSGTDVIKLRKRIKALISDRDERAAIKLQQASMRGDAFGEALLMDITGRSTEEQTKWWTLLSREFAVEQARPKKKFLDATAQLETQLGRDWLREACHHLIGEGLKMRYRTPEERAAEPWASRRYYGQGELFSGVAQAQLKSTLWTCLTFNDETTVQLVADLTEKAMTRIEGHGPSAPALANAGLHYLEQIGSEIAVARMTRLLTAIKQRGFQAQVRKALERTAEKSGLSPQQLAERSVPALSFSGGMREITFDDYVLRLTTEGAGRITSTWIKPDGTVQKTKPKFVAEVPLHKAAFAEIRAEITAAQKVLTAQRDRIDQLFAETLSWPLQDVEALYVAHDLIGCIAAKLIWTVDGTPALYRDGVWRDITGATLATSDATAPTELWHPIDWGTDDVLAWRERLSELDIIQPRKQAHREVYHLTDAERNTRVYSNRMSAHIVKQHQASTLMASRGWAYQIMKIYDDGIEDQFAVKSYSTHSVRGQFLFHSNYDIENITPAGMYLYAGTDQLRFVDEQDNPVPLDSLPKRLFSEVMREADLVVGVASVGNDPAWHDQGTTPEARGYWQHYSFGDLDGFAQTRRDTLERLLPRLKIRDVAKIEGRYLHVQGKLNSYRIHLGSSNIMMDPGDRYLCIVPGAVTKSKSINLPFEGDNRLSVILSKALMLAEDDKITASDIVRQLKR